MSKHLDNIQTTCLACLIWRCCSHFAPITLNYMIQRQYTINLWQEFWKKKHLSKLFKVSHLSCRSSLWKISQLALSSLENTSIQIINIKTSGGGIRVLTLLAVINNRPSSSYSGKKFATIVDQNQHRKKKKENNEFNSWYVTGRHGKNKEVDFLLDKQI